MLWIQFEPPTDLQLHQMPTKIKKMQPTFATLFCGCGGFDLGFSDAGYKCIGAFDNDANAVAVYNANHRDSAHVLDLSNAPPTLDKTPHVVIAGPPCQGFSTLGKRKKDDPRNSLLVRAATLAVALHPRVIAIENVTGALSGSVASHYRKAERILRDGGYHVSLVRVAAADFGLPQIRKRVILIAAQRPLRELNFTTNTPPVSLREALRGCNGSNHDPKKLTLGSIEYRIAKRIGPNQKLCNVRGGCRSIPTWEIPDVFGKTNNREREVLELLRKLRRQIRLRKSGDADPVSLEDISRFVNWDPAPSIKALQTKGYLKQVGGRFDFTQAFNGKFRRLSFDEPSPTVDTRFGEPRYFLHPSEDRGLSVREAARIQGFPDTFLFSGTKVQQHRVVGNAVPPPIALWLANEIRENLL